MWPAEEDLLSIIDGLPLAGAAGVVAASSVGAASFLASALVASSKEAAMGSRVRKLEEKAG